MNKLLLEKVILEQREVFENFEDLFEREIDEVFITNKKISILTGIRRSGKSTLLKQISKRFNGNFFYLNFEDDRLLNFIYEDFDDLLEIFIKIYGDKKVIFFDEIQNVLYFEKFLRRLFDFNYKIFVTGSNAKLLSKELGTHLTGRYLQYEVFPFSFKEYTSLKNITYENTNKKIALIKREFDSFLNFGGFYEVIVSKNKNELKQLYNDILIKDLIIRFKIREIKEFKELIFYLMSNITKIFSFNNLKNILNFSSTSLVKNYVNFFEDTYLIFQVNKFDYSLKKQMINPKKIYSIDTGLSSSVSFEFSQNLGRYLENTIFLHFKRQSIYEIFYHKNKFECDFLLKEKDKIIKAIQVTKTINYENEKRELNGLIEACKEHNLKEGFVLTYEGEQGEFIKEGIKVKIKQIWKYLLE